jgi:hypothetical protein
MILLERNLASTKLAAQKQDEVKDVFEEIKEF